MGRFKLLFQESGFGKDLEEIELNEKLYHSTTWEGLDNLFLNYSPEYNTSLSCSTKTKSKKLIGRDLCVVFRKSKRKVLYTPYDADAGKYYGWDEVRVKFKSKKDLKNNIEKIIIPKGTIKFYESLNEDDERMWILDLIYDNYNLFKESNNSFYNF